MARDTQKTTVTKARLGVGAALRALKRGPGVALLLMLIIWVALPLVPEETGLRFGMAYQVFFTSMVLLGALFFWLLGKESIPQPRGSGGVVGSLAAVLVLTLGLLVAAGVAYPQFELPRPPGAVAEEAADRGKELFWGSSVGCFRCHAVAGTGGARGPDLTEVAARAGQRVTGLSAEQYLLEKVEAGMTYQFKVPEYAPMMPPFGQFLSEQQIKDLVAYLLTLK
jgi:mono/diheme cytochrome c family protein